MIAMWKMMDVPNGKSVWTAGNWKKLRWASEPSPGMPGASGRRGWTDGRDSDGEINGPVIGFAGWFADWFAGAWADRVVGPCRSGGFCGSGAAPAGAMVMPHLRLALPKA